MCTNLSHTVSIGLDFNLSAYFCKKLDAEVLKIDAPESDSRF